MSRRSSSLTDARALRSLTTNGTPIAKAAAIVGCSRPMAYQLLSLLELTPIVQQMVDQGLLDISSARLLHKLSDGRTQLKVANRIVNERLSSRQAEQLIKRMLGQSVQPPTLADAVIADPNIRALCEDLSQRLGSPATLSDRNGEGALVIRFANLEILTGLLDTLAIAGFTYTVTFDPDNAHAGILTLPYRNFRELDRYLVQAGIETDAE